MVSDSLLRFDEQTTRGALAIQNWLANVEGEYHREWSRPPRAHELEWAIILWFASESGCMLSVDRIPPTPPMTDKTPQEECRKQIDDWIRGSEARWKAPVTCIGLWHHVLVSWLERENQAGFCHEK